MKSSVLHNVLAARPKCRIARLVSSEQWQPDPAFPKADNQVFELSFFSDAV